MAAPVGPGPIPSVSASVTVQLNDATAGAKAEFEKAVQDFALSLADEAQRQELSARPPGVTHLEVTSNSVVRAKQVLDQYGTKAKATKVDRSLLVATPLLALATGVLGSYLQDATILAIFIVVALLTGAGSIILAIRRWS
jgi:ferritin-like metal-binding protein YciE